MLTSYSQDDCEVGNPDFPYIEADETITYTPQASSLVSIIETNYHVKVYFHIINDDNGNRPTPVTQTMLDNAITNLNTHYNQFDIDFVLDGSGQVNNSNWMTIANSTEFLQLRTDAMSNGLFVNEVFNVFICDDYTTGAGVATKPGKTILIRDEYLLSSSLPHEFAHNLLIHHTHHGSNGSCVATTNGDYVNDTERSCPFSPSEINNCYNYSGSYIDGCGNGFTHVPADNFMSTNTLPCRDITNAVFSTGQGIRMKQRINVYLNTLYLNAIIKETTVSVYNSGTLVKFVGQLPNSSYSTLPISEEENENPNFIQNLDNGLYIIKKNYENGATEEEMILKH